MPVFRPFFTGSFGGNFFLNYLQTMLCYYCFKMALKLLMRGE